MANSLRRDLIKLAGELPQGDKTRREILAALSKSYKGQPLIEKILAKALSKFRPKKIETAAYGDELIIKLWETPGVQQATSDLGRSQDVVAEMDAVERALTRLFPGTRVEPFDAQTYWYSLSVKPLSKAVESFGCPCCGRAW